MEWDFKDFGACCWDHSSDDQLEQKEEGDSDLAALVGSSICCISQQPQGNDNTSAAAAAATGSLLVDLKLGSTDVADSTAAAPHLYGNSKRPMNQFHKHPIKPSTLVSSSPSPSPSPSSSSSPSPSSSRRVVNNNNGIGSDHQKVSCLVDGCKADLSRCREYHRRHRVCELHSKTPVVTLRGDHKRFCQQCSRFHSLVEFDEVKRSCRKRLNGHNQRRRKPKPESFYFTSNNFLSTYKGPRFLQFSNPQLCASTNVRRMWPMEAKNGAESMLYNRHPWLHGMDKQSPPNSYNGGEKPFLFLQTNDPKAAAANNRAAPQALMCQQQPFQTSAASPAETRKGMSSDGMTRGIDSGCALYLLSSHPTQTTVTGVNHSVLQSNVTAHPGQQFLDSRLLMNGFSEFSCSLDGEDKPVNPEMMFLTGHDGFSDNGAQILPILLE